MVLSTNLANPKFQEQNTHQKNFFQRSCSILFTVVMCTR